MAVFSVEIFPSFPSIADQLSAKPLPPPPPHLKPSWFFSMWTHSPLKFSLFQPESHVCEWNVEQFWSVHILIRLVRVICDAVTQPNQMKMLNDTGCSSWHRCWRVVNSQIFVLKVIQLWTGPQKTPLPHAVCRHNELQQQLKKQSLSFFFLPDKATSSLCSCLLLNAYSSTSCLYHTGLRVNQRSTQTNFSLTQQEILYRKTFCFLWQLWQTDTIEVSPCSLSLRPVPVNDTTIPTQKNVTASSPTVFFFFWQISNVP